MKLQNYFFIEREEMDKYENERTYINIIGSDTFLYSVYARLYVISMMSACDVDLLFKIPSTSFYFLVS